MNVPFSINVLCSLCFQENIHIDEQGVARIVEFTLATMILEPDITFEDIDESVEANMSRWCSPETLHPDSFGLTKARVTKVSDMYVYEVGPAL